MVLCLADTPPSTPVSLRPASPSLPRLQLHHFPPGWEGAGVRQEDTKQGEGGWGQGTLCRAAKVPSEHSVWFREGPGLCTCSKVPEGEGGREGGLT